MGTLKRLKVNYGIFLLFAMLDDNFCDVKWYERYICSMYFQ